MAIHSLDLHSLHPPAPIAPPPKAPPIPAVQPGLLSPLSFVGDEPLTEEDSLKKEIKRAPTGPGPSVPTAIANGIDFGQRPTPEAVTPAQPKPVVYEAPEAPIIPQSTTGEPEGSLVDVHWMTPQKQIAIYGNGLDGQTGGSLYIAINKAHTRLADQSDLPRLARPMLGMKTPDSLAIQRILDVKTQGPLSMVQTYAVDREAEGYQLDFSVAGDKARLTRAQKL